MKNDNNTEKTENITLIIKFFFISVLFCLILCCTILMNPDNDMWWMMATGRWIVEHKTLPQINPFVIHEQYRILVQQWIPAVLNYIVYIHFGKYGLVFLATFMGVVINLLIWIYAGTYTKSKEKRELLLFITFPLLMGFYTTRPTALFTIPIMLIWLYLIRKWNITQKSKYLYFLPLLSLIEVNAHALWILLFIFTIPSFIPKHIREWKDTLYANKKLFSFVCISMIVGIFNPYGLKGMTYLFCSYGESRVMQYIKELQSPSFSSVQGILLLIYFSMLVIYIIHFKKGVNLQHVAIFSGTFLMAMLHLRNLWMLIFGVIPIFIEICPDFQWKKICVTPKTKKIFGFFISICTILCFASAIKDIETGTDITLPIKEADYLDTHAVTEDVRLYTSFNDGGYMEWRGYKVYTDARPELFQKAINGIEDLDEEICNVTYGTINYDDFLKKYNFTHLLVFKNTPFSYYLKNNCYVLLEENEKYELYITN